MENIQTCCQVLGRKKKKSPHPELNKLFRQNPFVNDIILRVSNINDFIGVKICAVGYMWALRLGLRDQKMDHQLAKMP